MTRRGRSTSTPLKSEFSETSERQTIRHKRRTPSYFEYRPPPLRVNYGNAPLQIEPFLTRPTVDLILYDFGAVAAIYSVPIEGTFEDLLRLSEELYDNPFLAFRLTDAGGVATEGPWQCGNTSEPGDGRRRLCHFSRGGAFTIAGHRAVLQFPSASDRADTSRGTAGLFQSRKWRMRFQREPSYGIDDVVIIDWNAALLIDRDGDDVREVLQFANVELLEMRYLDQKLDGALDTIL